jgi:hypothetical protein
MTTFDARVTSLLEISLELDAAVVLVKYPHPKDAGLMFQGGIHH